MSTENQPAAGGDNPSRAKGPHGDTPTRANDPRADDPSRATNHRQDFSAGGVVVRGDDVAVIVPKRRGSHGGKVLGLPKGHLDGDETEVEAAIREVREETGLVAEPVAKLGEIKYSYERKGLSIDKRVVFYLLEYRSGDLSHDHEIEQVQWMPIDEAVDALTHSGEREMVARALSRRTSDR